MLLCGPSLIPKMEHVLRTPDLCRICDELRRSHINGSLSLHREGESLPFPETENSNFVRILCTSRGMEYQNVAQPVKMYFIFKRSLSLQPITAYHRTKGFKDLINLIRDPCRLILASNCKLMKYSI